MCEFTPKRCEIACIGACNSIIDYTKCDSSCVAKPVKKKTETALFTTEATQQKQRTTQNYSICSSVGISVHCCLHWCSHRHLASVFAPCIYPAILHRRSHLAGFHWSSLLCRFLLAIHIVANDEDVLQLMRS